MNNSPVKSELYVALEMVELTQFLPFTKIKKIKESKSVMADTLLSIYGRLASTLKILI